MKPNVNDYLGRRKIRLTNAALRVKLQDVIVQLAALLNRKY